MQFFRLEISTVTGLMWTTNTNPPTTGMNSVTVSLILAILTNSYNSNPPMIAYQSINMDTRTEAMDRMPYAAEDEPALVEVGVSFTRVMVALALLMLVVRASALPLYAKVFVESEAKIAPSVFFPEKKRSLNSEFELAASMTALKALISGWGYVLAA